MVVKLAILSTPILHDNLADFTGFTNTQILVLLLQFIAGEVLGVFSYAFCDFGQKFTIVDRTGEEPKECFVSSITKVGSHE